MLQYGLNKSREGPIVQSSKIPYLLQHAHNHDLITLLFQIMLKQAVLFAIYQGYLQDIV